jgi:uncharacterized membrane protein YdbT with pleckstrin-like domain
MNEEKQIWKGSSSPSLNIGSYAVNGLVLCAIATGGFIWHGAIFSSQIGVWLFILALIMPFLVAGWTYLFNRFRVYEVTSQRIKVTTGIFTRKTEETELYRIRDITFVQPLIQRFFGSGNIVLTTTDATASTLVLEAIPNAGHLRDELRKNIEICRDQKRVRLAELDGTDTPHA